MIIGILQGYTESYTNSTKLEEPLLVETDTRAKKAEEPKGEVIVLPPPANVRTDGITWSRLQYQSHVNNFKERGYVPGKSVIIKDYLGKHRQLGVIANIQEHCPALYTFRNSKYPRIIAVRLPLGAIMTYSIEELELVKC